MSEYSEHSLDLQLEIKCDEPQGRLKMKIRFLSQLVLCTISAAVCVLHYHQPCSLYWFRCL